MNTNIMFHFDSIPNFESIEIDLEDIKRFMNIKFKVSNRNINGLIQKFENNWAEFRGVIVYMEW